jgi:hypothetical protein
MFVQVRETNGKKEVLVFGEILSCNREGHYLLPGRLIAGLKPDDLPSGVCFTLSDQLPSGIRFFREDRVVFKRLSDEGTLAVEVLSTYNSAEWDGIFSLPATLEARRRVIEHCPDLTLRLVESTDRFSRVSFDFLQPFSCESDLEQTLESIWEKIWWVEEQGHRQLLFGSWHG